MHKICFSGYYGMNNYGDDLFAITCVLGSQQFWMTDPTILSSQIKGIEKYCITPKIFNDVYLSTDLKGKIVRGCLKSIALLKNDYLILGGGSTVSPRPPKLIDMYTKMPGGNTKLAGMGLSVEPILNKASEKKLKNFLNKFSYLSVRDEASYAYVSELGIECKKVLARDLVGILPKSNKIRRNEGRKTLGIAPCNYERYTQGDLIKEKERNEAIIGGILKFAKIDPVHVKIFVLNTHKNLGDWGIALSYKEILQKENIQCSLISNDTFSPLEIWQEIGNCDLFLSVRLHGAITAYLNDVPFTLIEYHKKCSEFLNDIGLYPEHRLGSILANDVFNTLVNMEKNWNGCHVSPAVYADQSKKNFSEFYEFIA